MSRAPSLLQPVAPLHIRRLRLLLRVAAALGVVAVCLEHGFATPPWPRFWLRAVQVTAVAFYILTQALEVLTAVPRRAVLRRRWFDLLLAAGCVGAFAIVLGQRDGPSHRLTASYLAAVRALLLIRVIIGAVRLNLALAQGRLRPGAIMALSFLIVIIIGGLLLTLPLATSAELRYEEGDYFWKRLLNCMFTSVSATCVTGLVIYDTGRDFTRFGQIVIMMLIQVGGLNTMIFGGLIGILAGRQLSLRQSLALQDALNPQTLGQVRQMVVFVLAATFGCELLGAAVLYPMWPASLGPPTERAFYSLFHAVAAFCNAGFALPSANLVAYRGAWQVYASIMPLIVVGGLGFPVLYDLSMAVRARFARAEVSAAPEGIVLPRSRAPARRHPLSLHTKLVLTTTVILIVGGTAGIFLFESTDWRGTQRHAAETAAFMPAMADMPAPQRFWAALFQSVSARTAGFNTVALDPRALSSASAYLLIILMFIGASPASTGGGVKTVSAATLVLDTWALLRARAHVEGFRRTIPPDLVRRALVVVLLMLSFIAVMTLLLCLTERGESLLEIQFELVSACGTVGLSTGLTPRLTIAGRLLIMLAMFVGRVGPLTLVASLAGRTNPARYEYPREQPIIG